MRILTLVTTILLLNACDLVGLGNRLPRETFAIHEVKYPGETLGIIAQWYTGNDANWKTILSYNGHIKTRRMKIGDNVRIPEAMLVKTSRLPQSFIKLVPADKSSPKVLLPVEPSAFLPQNSPTATPSPSEETDIEAAPEPEVNPDDVREQLLENLVK